ncbi:hypothetical protein BDF21DRAFT_403560 [Thamnidium elegans]|nr:hypothetical protein BDF21DRAFT_403560 [Thamnidium elegans]
MLVCNHRAFGGPALYKLYKTKKEITEVIPNNNTNKKNIVLGNLVNYLEYSHKFDQKTPLGFSQWLNSQNVGLTSTEPERKIIKTKEKEIELRSRYVYILDNKYYGKFEVGKLRS